MLGSRNSKDSLESRNSTQSDSFDRDSVIERESNLNNSEYMSTPSSTLAKNGLNSSGQKRSRSGRHENDYDDNISDDQSQPRIKKKRYDSQRENEDYEDDNEDDDIPQSQLDIFSPISSTQNHSEQKSNGQEDDCEDDATQQYQNEDNNEASEESEDEESTQSAKKSRSAKLKKMAQKRSVEKDDIMAEDSPDEEGPSTARSKLKSGKMSKEEVLAMAPSAGTIEKIYLDNFMCHKRLEVDLIPKVNFIIGHNGSGKSAILTALTICLGGKASFTNRASAVKSLLKEGESVGSVMVVIRNEGIDAYKPEVYGHKIKIERRFSKTGQSGYRILDSLGKMQSTKRSEILAICDHLSISIDNPMAILTQDTSRMFLANSTPSDKYNFFLRGTQLDQLASDRQKILQHIRTAESKIDEKTLCINEMREEVNVLQAKWAEIQKTQSLEIDIENIQKAITWKLIEEHEDTLKAQENECAKLKAAIEAINPKIEKYEKQEQEFDRQEKEIGEKISEYAKAMQDLDDRQNELRPLRMELQDKINALGSECRIVKNEIIHSEKSLKERQRQIDEEARKMSSHSRQKRQEKLDVIDAKKQELQSLEERLASMGGHSRSVMDEALRDLENRKHHLANEHSQIQYSIGRSKDIIRDLDAAKSNKLAAYGPDTQAVLNAIQAAESRREWRGHAPIGPFGTFITIKPVGQEYAKTIESILNSNLNGFVVDNHPDRDRLSSIFDRVIRNPRHRPHIFMQDGRTFNYDEPDEQYLTILRCIDISNPVVLRQLIINNKIEKTILVKDIDEGDRLCTSQGYVSRNISAIYTKDMVRIGNASGGYGTTAQNLYHGASRLTQNSEKEIAERRQDVQKKSRDLEDLQHRLQNIDKDIHQLRRDNDAKIRETRQLDNKISQLRNQIASLEMDVQDEEPSNMVELEKYKKEVEAVLDGLRPQLEELETKKASAEQECNEVRDRINQILAEKKQIEAEKQRHGDNKASDIFTNKRKAAVTKEKYMREKVNLEQNLLLNETAVVAAQTKLDEEIAKAELICERTRSSKSMKELERLHKQKTDFLTERRRSTGNKDDVWRELSQKKAKLEEATEEVESTKAIVKAIKKGLKLRIERWFYFRRIMTIRAKNDFTNLMSKRAFVARMEVDHERRTLDLKVDVHNFDESEAVEGKKDTNTLSGGEKSYSTVCLLLSLWNAMSNPFRALDEFDVFMDAMVRKQSMRMMIKHCLSEEKECQYIFITPQDMSHVPGIGNPDIKIVRLSDPERNQSVLNFAPS